MRPTLAAEQDKNARCDSECGQDERRVHNADLDERSQAVVISLMPSKCTRPKRRWPQPRSYQASLQGHVWWLSSGRRPDLRTASLPACYHLTPVLFPSHASHRPRHGSVAFDHAPIVSWAERRGSKDGHPASAPVDPLSVPFSSLAPTTPRPLACSSRNNGPAQKRNRHLFKR